MMVVVVVLVVVVVVVIMVVVVIVGVAGVVGVVIVVKVFAPYPVRSWAVRTASLSASRYPFAQVRALPHPESITS